MEVQRQRYSTALREAASVLGGTTALARFLGVEPGQLARWLAGEEAAPLSVFLSTLDVIADGPYARGQRKVRVAVIRPEEETKSRS
jgi:hypothetical protein